MVMDLLYCFGHAEITGFGNVLKTSAYVDWLQHPMWIVVLRHFSKLRVALTVVETSVVRVRHAWWPVEHFTALSCVKKFGNSRSPRTISWTIRKHRFSFAPRQFLIYPDWEVLTFLRLYWTTTYSTWACYSKAHHGQIWHSLSHLGARALSCQDLTFSYWLHAMPALASIQFDRSNGIEDFYFVDRPSQPSR